MYSLASQIEVRSRIPAGNQRATVPGLFRGLPLETLPAGAAAFWAGDPAAHVFEVIEGVVRVFKDLADGRRAITGFMYPGDLMGVSVADAYVYSAEAVNDVKLRRLSRGRFEDEIAKSPELRSQVIAHLCDEMAAAQDQMVLLARKTAEERVSTLLIRMAQRQDGLAGPGARLEVPMTRADMADYLGLTLETVSRLISRLASGGIIAATGRHSFEIRKWSALARRAGEEDAPAPGRLGRSVPN